MANKHTNKREQTHEIARWRDKSKAKRAGKHFAYLRAYCSIWCFHDLPFAVTGPQIPAGLEMT
jgi:hypothetical protein